MRTKYRERIAVPCLDNRVDRTISQRGRNVLIHCCASARASRSRAPRTGMESHAGRLPSS